MRCLVVYYSLSGNTKAVAEQIARQCNGDIEQIRDVDPRSGIWAMVSSGREAMFKQSTAIRPTQTDPGKYDLVILGTPVWAWTMSSPMRAYLNQYADRFKQVAFFCTAGSSGGARTFRHMSALAGTPPLATLELTEADLKLPANENGLQGFIAAIAVDSADPENVAAASADSPLR